MRRWTVGLLMGVCIGVSGSMVLAQSSFAITTPEAPATLSSVWHGASTAEGRPREVLQAVTVTVGPGGSAGLVRLRVSDPAVDAWMPILADGLGAAPPELQRGDPPPTVRQPGQRLQLAPVSEVDLDGDLSGDRTEDRTDLSVRADAVRGRDGRLTITVTNRGPRTADWPQLTVDRSQASGWMPACVTTSRCSVRRRGRSRCAPVRRAR